MTTEILPLSQSCTPLAERLGVSIKSSVMTKRGPEDAPFSLFGFETVTSTMDVSGGVAEGEILPSDLLPYRLFVQETRSGVPGDETIFPARSAYLALAQTKGRGRKQRSWVSAESKGIYVTFFTQTASAPAHLSGLSLAVGLAVQDFFSELGVKCFLKWPNDVLAAPTTGGPRRKLAGILVDTHASRSLSGVQAVHVGVGVNLARQSFPEGVPGISLEELTREPVSYPSAVAALLSSVNRTLTIFLEKGFAPFAPLWNEKAGTVGEDVEVDTAQGPVRGIILGVGPDGGLQLKDASTGKPSVIYSGEIG